MRLDALKPNKAAQAHPGRRETGPYKALRCPCGSEPVPQSHGQPEKSTIKIPQGRICYSRPGDQRHQKGQQEGCTHPCSSNTHLAPGMGCDGMGSSPSRDGLHSSPTTPGCITHPFHLFSPYFIKEGIS